MRSYHLVLVAAVLAFGASLLGSFHFDDYALFNDPAVYSAPGWLEVWEPTHTRPLTWFTFWINHQLDGRNPAGYHAVNLLLHAACALLVLVLLERFLPPAAAVLGALLFAVHPIQAEAVNYVFARSTLLMTLFSLLALEAWTRKRRCLAVVWFIPALLSKEECVTLPLFLLLLEGWRAWRPVGAMLGLAAAAGLRTVWVTSLQAGSGAGLAAGVTPLQYASMQGIAILRYLRLLVWPWGFTPDPDLEAPAMWLRVAAGVLVVGVFGVALWRRNREAAWIWLAGGLILLGASSSVLPAADLAADRRLYLPMVAFAAGAGLLAARNWRVSAGVLLVLTAVSVRYSLVWRTERSLWREAVAQAPDKVRPKLQLARATRDKAEALELLETSKRLAPDNAGLASDLGRAYLDAGRVDLALQEFGRALALEPRSPLAMTDRARALLALGDRTAALAEYRRALTVDGCFVDAHYALRKLGESTAIPAECRYPPGIRELLEHPELP